MMVFRYMIIALLMLIVVVACGEAGAGQTETPAPSGESATTPAATELQEEAETRLVTHVMGETEVPANPRRVVVLDTGELDMALTLGITPVGAVEAIPGEGFPSYLEGTEGIENVGTIAEPNLEKIAALKPDLILSSKLRHEAIYDQLSQIAPTVFAERTGVMWKENFDLFSEALGLTDEAELVKQEYQERVEAFQQAMGDDLDEIEVSVVRFLPGDTRIYQKASFIGTVLEDAGLPRPSSQDVDEFAIMNASAEIIPEIGGDVIFVTVYGPEDETTKSEFLSHPLWQQLDAVQEGTVYEVSDDLWMLGIGYTAANQVIDDLTHYLMGSEQAGHPSETTGTRVVSHAMGETEVPANPQRVVVLDMSELDMSLALGVTPIGYATYTADEDLAPYLKERITGSEWVGTIQQPNLEAILALNPDLILTNKLRHEEIYDQLSQIAPTVMAETVKGEWKTSLKIHAEALGRTTEAAQVMARYQQRLEEFKDAMGPRLAGTEISLIRSFPDHVRIYMKDSFMGTVIADAGLPRPAAQDKDIFMEKATAERIPDFDGDVMFVTYWNREQGEQLSQLTQHQLWSQLDVVKQGRVYEIDDRVWGTGLGPLAANLIIDDLFTYLVEDGA